MGTLVPYLDSGLFEGVAIDGLRYAQPILQTKNVGWAEWNEAHHGCLLPAVST